MHKRPFFPFSLLPGSRLALAGQQLAYCAAFVLIKAVHVMLVMVLRLLRPFIVLPLVLVMVGGVGTVLVFSLRLDWRDAGEAGLVTFLSAVLLTLYAMTALWLDPSHFEDRPVPSWKRYL